MDSIEYTFRVRRTRRSPQALEFCCTWKAHVHGITLAKRWRDGASDNQLHRSGQVVRIRTVEQSTQSCQQTFHPLATKIRFKLESHGTGSRARRGKIAPAAAPGPVGRRCIRVGSQGRKEGLSFAVRLLLFSRSGRGRSGLHIRQALVRRLLGLGQWKAN